MITGIEYEKLLKAGNDYIFADTRCKREYDEATIPGAVNIPLFSDEEYEAVGIAYKNEGKGVSVLLGIDFISKRLPSLFREFNELRKKYRKTAVFCARGGMRSSSIGSLLQSVGMNIVKVESGYKGYRHFINKALPEMVDKLTFIPLYGKTGSGKTFILNELKTLGHPVLDLEACANHRGSLLGGIGLGSCNSQKMFESLVFDTLYKLNTPYVFTEGESKRIGKIIMPDYLYDKITAGVKLNIETDLAKRVYNIKKEYIKDNTDNSEIKRAVESMEPYIGKAKTAYYTAAVSKEEYDKVIEELILNYYDKSYSKKNADCAITFHNLNERETAVKIADYVNNFLSFQA